jgi:aminopeptidase N
MECGVDCSKRSVSGSTSANYFQNNLMNKYDIKYLKLDISVEPASKFISGSCVYRVITKQPLDTFAIEFKQAMTLDSVIANNTKRNFTRSADHIYIAFSPFVATGSPLEVKFYYSGTPQNGISSGTDANIGLNYSGNVSESFQAREWFPAKQLLNDKIDSADIWLTTTAPNIAASNGLLKMVVDLPNNKKQYQWHTNYPMNYYMPFFGVGNYMDYRNYAKPLSITPDSVLIQHLLVNNQTYFNSQKVNLDKTPPYLEKMSELFGIYPFYKEKYGHAQVRIGGGMEHQTMSTMHDFSQELIPHELAHQWFGDNVTCATWNDIWLNEGFASYSQYLMREKLPALFSNNSASHMTEVHANVLTLPGGSVYVPLQDSYNEGRIFNSKLSYNKGSAAIHNLRFEMQNDTFFFNTFKTFQQKFKDSFATTNDFKQVAEQVSGKNLSTFFNQWIYGEGYPTYSVTYGKPHPDSLVFTIDQTTSMPSVTSFFSGLLELKITSAQGDTIIKVNHTLNNQQFRIRYTKSPSGIEVDPNNWIINKVGSVVTGINIVTPAQAGVKVYPNPATNLLNITFSGSTFQSLQVLDLQGRLLKSSAIPAGTTMYRQPINFPPGAYIIRLLGKKESVIQKILIQ